MVKYKAFLKILKRFSVARYCLRPESVPGSKTHVCHEEIKHGTKLKSTFCYCKTKHLKKYLKNLQCIKISEILVEKGFLYQ